MFGVYNSTSEHDSFFSYNFNKIKLCKRKIMYKTNQDFNYTVKYQFTAYNYGWYNEIAKIPRVASTIEVTSSITDFPYISYEPRLLASNQLTGYYDIAEKTKVFLVDLHK